LETGHFKKELEMDGYVKMDLKELEFGNMNWTEFCQD
jgi:hypothetical protein